MIVQHEREVGFLDPELQQVWSFVHIGEKLLPFNHLHDFGEWFGGELTHGREKLVSEHSDVPYQFGDLWWSGQVVERLRKVSRLSLGNLVEEVEHFLI